MGSQINYKVIKDDKTFELANIDGQEGIVGRTIKEEFWSTDEFLNMASYGSKTKDNMSKDLKNFKETLKMLDTKSFVKELKSLKDKMDFLARVDVNNFENVRSGLGQEIEKVNKRIKEIDSINKQLNKFIADNGIKKKTDNMVG